MRVVRESVPVRPGTINRSLRGDAETIVLKALEKERDRRYGSAADLADDIDRYLNNEPITARLPSALYQARKLIRRHKLPAGLAAVVFLVVAVAAVWLGILYARTQSLLHQTQTTAVVMDRALSKLDGMGANDPGLGRMVDEAIAIADTELMEQPLAQATLYQTCGRYLAKIGIHNRAEELLIKALSLRRESLGGNDILMAQSYEALGRLYISRGDYARSLPHLERAGDLYAREEESWEFRWTRHSLAYALTELARYADAEAIVRELAQVSRQSVKLEDPSAGGQLLAVSLRLKRGDLSGAEQLCREGLATWREMRGEDDPMTIHAEMSLAGILWTKGEYNAAEALLRRILTRLQLASGENSLWVMATPVGHYHIKNHRQRGWKQQAQGTAGGQDPDRIPIAITRPLQHRQ